jgi:uncharacterized DUF497 family protein
MTIFEWDDHKSNANKFKHGIDFDQAKALWDDPSRVEIKASFPDEERNILIGKIEEKIWAVIFTVRNQSIRIISARRAREKEALLYGQE